MGKLRIVPYQQVGAAFIAANRRCILGDDARFGKNIQFITGLQPICNKVLVLTLSTVRDEIARQIRDATGEEVVVVHKPKDLANIKTAKWVVANYESIRAKKYASGIVPYGAASEVLLRTLFDCVVVDEAHTVVCNIKSLWYLGLEYLLKRGCRLVLMSATLIDTPLDAYGALRLINPKQYPSKWRFLTKHANAHEGKFGWEFTRTATNPAALAAELAPYMLRRTLADVVHEVFPGASGEPPILREKEYVEPCPEQIETFNAIVKDMIYESDDDYVLIENLLVAATRIRQLSISPKMVGLKTIGPKIPRVMELIQSHRGGVVVYSCFAEALDLLYAEHSNVGDMVVISGGVHGVSDKSKRQEAIDAFNNGKYKVIALTIDAGGPGIDLSSANRIIMMDRHWSARKNYQAELRCSGFLQQNPVEITSVITNLTWDHGKSAVKKPTTDEYLSDLSDEKQEGADSVYAAMRQLMRTIKNGN